MDKNDCLITVSLIVLIVVFFIFISKDDKKQLHESREQRVIEHLKRADERLKQVDKVLNTNIVLNRVLNEGNEVENKTIEVVDNDTIDYWESQARLYEVKAENAKKDAQSIIVKNKFTRTKKRKKMQWHYFYLECVRDFRNHKIPEYKEPKVGDWGNLGRKKWND